MLSRIIGGMLLHSQETKTFIGVRKNNDETNRWIGYIKEFNEKLFVLQHISPLGFEDGLIIEEINNIDNFEINDVGIKAIETLYKNNKKILQQEINTVKISTEENWQFELLQSAFDQGKLISIEINNNDSITYGFVIDFDETLLQIIALDVTGEENGTETYKLADITSITIDRLEGRKRELLYELRLLKNK
jgi:hypothetical protein